MSDEDKTFSAFFLVSELMTSSAHIPYTCYNNLITDWNNQRVDIYIFFSHEILS